MEKEPCNILVFNVNWIGDVIFTSPVFKALRQTYPDSWIICLAVPRVREILESMPDIDEVIDYDERGRHRSLWGKIQLIHHLRSRKIDLAFLLHRSWTRACLVFLAGIPVRVGYGTKRRGALLTHSVPSPGMGLHRSDFYLEVIRSWGVAIKDRLCGLQIDQASQDNVLARLQVMGISDSDTLAVLHVGGNWELKRWPNENFSELIRRLHKEMGMRIVIPGSARDHFLAQGVIPPEVPGVYLMAGQTNLKQLIALMARADLVVSADSGPLHIANCVGTKAVALFGPTSPEITGPRGKGEVVILRKDLACNRHPCYNLDCLDNQCMRSITVDDVMQAVRRIMPKGKHPGTEG